MINNLLDWIHGYVYIIIKGENISRFLNICSARNFYISSIRYRNDDVIIRIYIKDFFKLRPIVKKCKIRIRIYRKCGLPIWINKYKKRQMMFFGILSSFILMYVFSLFVWQISIEGNYSYSDEEILDYIEELGITHGIRKSKIDGESIEKAIRNKYFDITWVSAELSGTRLILHIKENFHQLTKEGVENSVGTTESYDVVANEDGIIVGMVTRKGTALVDIGDVIKKGDVLIKGEYNIVNDAGEVIDTKVIKADGTIYIYATYEYSSELDLDYKIKEYYDEYNEYTFALGKYIFDFSLKNNNEVNEDVIYNAEQLKITNNFYLPIYVYTDNHKMYKEKECRYTKEECKKIMNERISYFLENLCEKSIQMVENNVKIEFTDDKCLAKGDIVVLKEIE